MSWLAEFLSELIYWLRTDEFFRSGFFTGIVFCVAVAILWRLLFATNVHWKKFRQFFEPTKKPGKMPVELGPSPARMALGCMGQVFLVLFVITLMILLVWNGFPEL